MQIAAEKHGHRPNSRLRTPKGARTGDWHNQKRCSQAERSATTRAKIIEGAIRCLNKCGYAATTFAKVSKESGVSRGGMLHQFPGKVDLMLAVVSFASGASERWDSDAAMAISDPRKALMRLTDDVWRALTLPAAMAKLEIVIAARSDSVLAAKLPKLYAKIEERRREYVWAIAKAAGVRDKKKIDAMVTLHVAAMRGLAIERMVMQSDAHVQQAFNLLKRYKESLVRELLL
jgi:AcrR family transcriptional regulator